MKGAPGLARQDIAFSIPGNFPLQNEVIFTIVAARDNTFSNDFSLAVAGNPPANNYTMLIKKNSVTVGQISFAAGNDIGVVHFSDPVQLRLDVLTIVTPSIADLDISDIAITLAGSY